MWDRPQAVAGLLDRKIAEARAAEGELRDVLAEVQAIEARMRDVPVPPPLTAEGLTPEAARTYAASLQEILAQTEKDAGYLQTIAGRTDKVDRNTLQRLTHWVGQDRMRRLDESLQQTQVMLAHGWEPHARTLAFHAADDPEDPNHQANRFLGESVYETNLQRFQEMLSFVATAETFESAFGLPGAAERAGQRAAIEQAIGKYEQDYRRATAAVRLHPGIDDPELRRIARETLESGRYEEIIPIVRIATGKKSRRKEARSSVSGTVTGASVTTHVYEWDEFQARTVEKVGERYFIFVNDLKYFRSGGSTTPLGRWVLSGRFKSTPILEENIDK